MNEHEKIRLREALCGFTGTEYFYKHWTAVGCYTDGVKYLAESAGCFWLLAKVFTLQSVKMVSREEFQLWTLTILDGAKAELSCEDGNGHAVYRESIVYTDFPLPEGIMLYYENSTLCLPQER